MVKLMVAGGERFVDWAVRGHLRRDADLFRRARRMALLDASFLGWVLVFAGVFFLLGAPRAGLVTLTCLLWIGASFVALVRGRSVAWAGNLLCLGGSTTLAALALVSGGAMSPPLFWLSCAPVVAVLTAGAGWGALWLAISLVIVGGLVGGELAGVKFANDLAPAPFKLLYYAVLGGLLACQFVMVRVRVGIEQRAADALRETEARLAEAQRLLDALQGYFDFSPELWEQLKREKAALEYALHCRDEVDDAAVEAEVNAVEAALARMG